MPLSTFATAGPKAAADLVALADSLRYIRDSSGDITYQALNAAQNALRAAKLSAIAALTEAQKQPGFAETFMADMGGPETIAAYHASLADVETKAAAWNGRLATALSNLSANDLVGLVITAQGGVETKHIAFASFLPAAAANPLRETQELADLIAALETLGA